MNKIKRKMPADKGRFGEMAAVTPQKKRCEHEEK